MALRQSKGSESGEAAAAVGASKIPRFVVAWLIIASAHATHAAYQLSVPLFVSVSNPNNQSRQGFVRIINHSEVSDRIDVVAIDDRGKRLGPVSLSLSPWQTIHFNSNDLETGNDAKGIPVGVGTGAGDWRLEIHVENDDLDLEALAYVRTQDGFLTSIHQAVPGKLRHRVAIFNPGSNLNQVSRLRLINLGKDDANVSIVGVDDSGSRSPEVTVALPPDEAYSFTAQDLEYGHQRLDGTLGDGSGKWQLFITSDRAIQVMSMMETPSGHLTNLSSPGSEEDYRPPP